MKRRRTVKMPTLLEVTGERPTCQRCGKALAPQTSSFDLPDHVERPPSAEELRALADDPRTVEEGKDKTIHFNESVYKMALGWGYESSRVYKIAHDARWDGTRISEVHYWWGSYDGYGRGKGRDAPLFCSQPCAIVFASLSWNAGMRIVNKDKKS